MTAFLLTLSLPFGSWAQGPQPTPTPGDSLQVEKLELEIEKLKLENERLKLEMKSLQIGNGTAVAVPVEGTSPTPSPTPAKKDARFALDMAAKAEALAKENANDEHKVVLDFSNGEFWYKGVRSKMNDFKVFCSDEKLNVKPLFLKYDINGDSMNRFQYRNLYLDIYSMQSRGVFNLEAPKKDGDFAFVTPESPGTGSSFGDFRNHFETAYFTFDKEDRQKGFRILRFKHTAGFLGFDDVLEFWFDKKDDFVSLKWGMLDKK